MKQSDSCTFCGEPTENLGKHIFITILHGVLKKQNCEGFSLNFYIDESQPMIFYTK